MSKILDSNLDILNRRVNFLEEQFSGLTLSNKPIEDIMNVFIKKALVLSKTKKLIAFDSKLKKNGIYPRFLSFYHLHYSFLKLEIDQKIIFEEFENALTKSYSYDLVANRHKTVKDNISYNNLKFVEVKVYEESDITIKSIMNAFILENICFSVDEQIYFNKNPIGNSIYSRFLRFYFLYYSFVQINLKPSKVLESFDESLRIIYSSRQNEVYKRKLKNEIIYKSFQFKKI
jgi:hypothetical protein